jgi:formamidopyrimidine-DNA glycosylase
MPELPDLHVFSENLKKRILNKEIADVIICNPRKISAPDSFRGKLTGTVIEDIVRSGKELFFHLGNGGSFSVHLMLHGRFSVCNRDGIEKINAKITALCFKDEETLVISDADGLCKVTLNPKAPGTPDALSDSFTYEYFSGMIKKNASKNIKAVLTDQNVVRGIGNAYVDEILWKAGVSPESITGKIPEQKVKDIYEAIPFIFRDAIQNIQRISPDIISGEERSFLRVHNFSKQYTDEGDRIIKKDVPVKNTFSTDKQKLYK